MSGSVLLIDNYDSFTFNLAHLIGAAGAEPVVVRNDAITAEAAIARGDRAIVLSPGPCTPDDAGVCLDLVARAAEAGTPVFGVCLGLQSIVQALGGTIRRAGRLMHGKVSLIEHDNTSIFKGLNSSFDATRYHSLSAEESAMPPALRITARAADDNEIMAVAHREKPIHAVQFHPESIASAYGLEMLTNFLTIADDSRRA